MPILLLAEEVQASLRAGLSACKTQEQVNDFLGTSTAFNALIYSAKKIIHQEKFVQINGFPILDDFGWRYLTGVFGEYYDAVERTGIKTDCDYTGCSLNPLILHNDDAVDIRRQPRYGFIQVTHDDPLFVVPNGVVLVRELVRKLKFEDPELLTKLLTTNIPMLSYGVNFDDKNKEELFIEAPVIYKSNAGEYCVRFDYERVMFYYREKNLTQSRSEAQMVYFFLQHAAQIKKKIFLSEGNILVHDNRCTLHDRDECSIKIKIDGSSETREIAVSFAR
jgi:hypothetical protein